MGRHLNTPTTPRNATPPFKKTELLRGHIEGGMFQIADAQGVFKVFLLRGPPNWYLLQGGSRLVGISPVEEPIVIVINSSGFVLPVLLEITGPLYSVLPGTLVLSASWVRGFAEREQGQDG